MGRVSQATPLTYSIQDYLKKIYELTGDGKPAGTTALAKRLGISPGSVTGMLQKMAAGRPALVSYKKHRGARLTDSGRRAALEVIRHHRLLETWLVQTLGYSWDEVHGEAEKLEHAMSEDLERRISQALGNPVRDPHGEPIPSVDLIMPPDRSVPLSELRLGDVATVLWVQTSDGRALRQLKSMGVRIGSTVEVVSLSNYDQLMSVQIRGEDNMVTLGPALTERVHVERSSKP